MKVHLSPIPWHAPAQAPSLAPAVPPRPSLASPDGPCLLPVPAGHLDTHAGRVQVPWGIGLLRGKDMLASRAALPSGGPRTEGEVRWRHRGGATPCGVLQGAGAAQRTVQAAYR